MEDRLRIQMQLSAVLAAMVPTAALAGEPLAQLTGSWRGAEIVTAEGIRLEPADLDRSIAAGSQGFTIRWTVPELGPAEIAFVPGPRPGVFQVRQGGGLLARVFSPGTGSPLDGDRLVWARAQGEALVVYGLVIDPAGRFTIDRQLQVRDGEGLRVEFSRLRQGEPEIRAVGRLVREGR